MREQKKGIRSTEKEELGSFFVRIAVVGSGCSGLSYSWVDNQLKG